MSAETLTDADARRIAQSEFHRPLVVEAGAGTGKTALLTARIVVWLFGGGWKRARAALGDAAAPHAVAGRALDRVLAITFTEAAAAEMAARVADTLDALARDAAIHPSLDVSLLPEEGTRRVRAAALADEVHRLRVQTIHSACRSLLAAHALEAGLHPGADVDGDGSRLRRAVEETVDEALRALGRELPDGWRAMAERGIGPAEAVEALTTLVGAGMRPDLLESMQFDQRWSDRAAADLRGFVTEFFGPRADGARLEHAARGDKAAATVRALRGLERALGTQMAAESLCALAREFDDAALDRLGDWSKGTFTKGETAALESTGSLVARASGGLVETLTELRECDPGAFRATVSVLAPMVGRVRERLRAGGVLQFEDLLRETLQLIERAPAVAERIRAGLDQLLVDEFQDTDAVQCRIVERLGLADGPGPGLFVVGDPKQSIYAWRGADLEAYHRFVERVRDWGGERLALTSNFRSCPEVLAAVTRFVEPVMVGRPGVQAEFEALDPAGGVAGDPGPSGAPVEVWLTWALDASTGVPAPVARNGARSGDAVEVEAHAVADDILARHGEGGLRWGDVAVMVRSTTQTGPVLEALRARGIPFEISRERDYYRQREVVEAAAFVRVAMEPDDRLGLLTVLRSGEVGIPDAALPALWSSGFPAAAAALHGADRDSVERALATVRTAAKGAPRMLPGVEEVAGWPVAVSALVVALASARQAVEERPPHRLVPWLRHLWLSEATAGGRRLGEARQARLERFWHEVGALLAQPEATPADVARGLRTAVEEAGVARVNEQPDTEADRVHVFTIHGAKGLGFEHVYLIQTHREDGGRPKGSQTEVIGSALAPSVRLFGLPSPDYGRARRRQTDHAEAERVRLLYVALTRARRRLVISGGMGPKQSTGSRSGSSAGSFADLLGARLPPTLGLEERERVDGAVRFAVVTPEAEVVPILSEASDEAATRQEARALEERMRTTAEAVRAASRRERRPVSVAASGLARHDDPFEQPFDGGAPSLERARALAVGTAVHRVLEHIELTGADPGAAFSAALEAELERLDVDDEVIAELGRRIAGGACLRRLATVADAVVARELPVLLAAEPDAGDGPLGCVVGSVDLVYRDPEDGALVVADYKTDHVEGAALADRERTYRPQLEAYASAVQQALGLAAPPECELWFLWPDAIVRWA